ncbi:hypothetical protein E2C01_052714 [Portunus trituberculatus]|uniref:Uncharacterized protein n=1 Tax=Portunus trituberculatus TaxID=210409 RepID=A0A5B7GN90_PORTR|nr:hypothetical protein [Portunus trituberculatus]
MVTVSREPYECMGSGVVQVCLASGVSVPMSVVAISSKPLNFAFILSMNGITALHDIRVRSQTDVLFGLEEEQGLAVAAATSLDIDERDFKVTFNTNTNQWTVLWNWCDSMELPQLFNTASEYKVARQVWLEYENE